MRIHGMGFTRREIEELRIEAVPVRQNPAPFAIAFARLFGRAEITRLIQVLLGVFHNAAGSLDQLVPELGDIQGPWKFPRHADYRNVGGCRRDMRTGFWNGRCGFGGGQSLCRNVSPVALD